jgi:hypothetical protein
MPILRYSLLYTIQIKLQYLIDEHSDEDYKGTVMYRYLNFLVYNNYFINVLSIKHRNSDIS